jgi:hypothetical protein
MVPIHIDKASFECCALETDQHLLNSLGSPIKLSEHLTERMAEDWAINSEGELTDYLLEITGKEYRQVTRDNTYNNETDLDTFFIYTIYAPVGVSDWCWCDDLFVVVELGSGGDPRYSAYGQAKVYRVDNIGESGFFDMTLGWYAEPIAEDYYSSPELERINDRLSVGYTSNPTYELESLLMQRKDSKWQKCIEWSDKLGCFVGRLLDVEYVVKLHPTEPCYG